MLRERGVSGWLMVMAAECQYVCEWIVKVQSESLRTFEASWPCDDWFTSAMLIIC